jgi:hypothetical protein
MNPIGKRPARDLLVRTTDEPVVAYRIVRDSRRAAAAMLDSFRSNYELGASPRGLEVESALIHLGLSMYLKLEMATATARRWPRIGRHIAAVRLMPDNGFCYAATAQPGHLTGLGSPAAALGLRSRYPACGRLTMHYVLLSSTGNLIDSYEKESEALDALRRIVEAEPDAAEDVALMTYGDDGMPLGDPIFANAPSGVG